MLCECGDAIWKVLNLQCSQTTCRILSSKRNPVCHGDKHVGRSFLQRFGVFKWEYLKGERNVADALSRGDVTASLLRSVDSGKAKPFGAVVATAGAVAPSRETFQFRVVPGQANSTRSDRSAFCFRLLT